MKMATLGSLFLLVVACVAAAGAEDNWLVGWLVIAFIWLHRARGEARLFASFAARAYPARRMHDWTPNWPNIAQNE